MRTARLRFTSLIIVAAVAVAAALGTSTPALAAKNLVYAPGGVAIKGYDPVAYFTIGQPVKGKSEFAVKWMGATWHFSSATNRDVFKAMPAKYAPKYGGWCAYAVGRYNSLYKIDPHSWKIVGGKLYLNAGKSVQRDWEKDVPGYITKADKYWPSLVEKHGK